MKPLDQIFPLEILTQLASQHQIHPGLLWDQLQAAADAFQAATVGKDKNMVSMMREMEMLAERIAAFAAEIENPRVQSWLAAEAVEMLRQQRGPSMAGPGGEDASARDALNEAGHIVQNDVASLRRLADLAMAASKRDLEPGRLALAKRQAASNILVQFWIREMDREPTVALENGGNGTPLVAFVFDCLAPMGAVRTPGECVRVLQSMQGKRS